MAKKSKTQRAKASARRAERKAQAVEEELVEVTIPEPAKEEKKKRGISKLVSRSSSGKKDDGKSTASSNKKEAAKTDKKKKPGLFSRMRTFFGNVRSEMHRVTWPTKLDVARWSGVVVVALLFFGIYVFVLDSWIVTPVLMAISTLGA